MSLDKAIRHGREHRKPYYKSQRFDPSCRNHGSCGYCEGNRLYKRRRAEYFADLEIADRAFILCALNKGT